MTAIRVSSGLPPLWVATLLLGGNVATKNNRAGASGHRRQAPQSGGRGNTVDLDQLCRWASSMRPRYIDHGADLVIRVTARPRYIDHGADLVIRVTARPRTATTALYPPRRATR